MLTIGQFKVYNVLISNVLVSISDMIINIHIGFMIAPTMGSNMIGLTEMECSGQYR